MPPGARADPDRHHQARPEGSGHRRRGSRRPPEPDGAPKGNAAVNAHHLADAGYVIIEPLHDPLEQPDWLRSASNDLLAYITPILGPTATLIVHRYAWYFAVGDTWHHIELTDLGATFGVNGRGVNSTILRSLQRIHRFGFGKIEPHAPKIRIRTAIPPLSRQLAQSLPGHLADHCPYVIR